MDRAKAEQKQRLWKANSQVPCSLTRPHSLSPNSRPSSGIVGPCTVLFLTFNDLEWGKDLAVYVSGGVVSWVAAMIVVRATTFSTRCYIRTVLTVVCHPLLGRLHYRAMRPAVQGSPARDSVLLSYPIDRQSLSMCSRVGKMNGFKR